MPPRPSRQAISNHTHPQDHSHLLTTVVIPLRSLTDYALCLTDNTDNFIILNKIKSLYFMKLPSIKHYSKRQQIKYAGTMSYNRVVQYLQHHGKQENYLQFKDETWLILCCKTRRFGMNTLYVYITAVVEQLSYAV